MVELNLLELGVNQWPDGMNWQVAGVNPYIARVIHMTKGENVGLKDKSECCRDKQGFGAESAGGRAESVGVNM